MDSRIWGAIIGAAVAWGTSGVGTRAALNAGVPPMALATIRVILAVIVLYGLLRLRGHRISRDPYLWVTGIVAGVFQLAVPFVLFTLAYQYASAGFVGLLLALSPLGTATVAHFMLPDEPLHLSKVAGLAVALGGVAFLLLSGDSGLAEGGRPLLAAALGIVAAASISVSTVFTKGRLGEYDPMELTWMQFTVGLVLVAGTMLIGEGIPGPISPWGWTLIIYLTVIGSIVPFVLFYWLLQQVSSTKASLVSYVVPLIALVLGILLLNERLDLGIAIGGALILIGVVLTDRAERLEPAPLVS